MVFTLICSLSEYYNFLQFACARLSGFIGYLVLTLNHRMDETKDCCHRMVHIKMLKKKTNLSLQGRINVMIIDDRVNAFGNKLIIDKDI